MRSQEPTFDPKVLKIMSDRLTLDTEKLRTEFISFKNET